MTNNNDVGKKHGGLPAPAPEHVRIKKRRGMSLIWVLPLIAAVVAGWLIFTTFAEQGPEISIQFQTAEGLESGKTKVTYRSVTVGTVKNVQLSEDLSHIEVTADIGAPYARYMTTGTQFWVVRPRLSAAGISGLGTLVSGAYVEMEPGPGARTHDFIGLEDPPVVATHVPGHQFTLISPTLGSISAGSPVIFRGITVGEVLGYELSADRQKVYIPIFIRAPHDALVRDDTNFWNVSGVDVNVSAQGVQVDVGSLQTVISGGVAFETPLTAMKEKASEEGKEFRLFDNHDSIAEARYTERNPYVLYFDGSVRGLSPGASVEFRGIKVGEVSDVHLVYDVKTQQVRIPVVIQLQPQRIVMTEVVKADHYPEQMEHFVEKGLRAQLRSGNLLTGQLYVALDFFPDSPPATLIKTDTYPQIPTVPTQIEELTKTFSGIVERVNSLPIEQMIAEVRQTIKTLNDLLGSRAVANGVQSLDQVGPLLKSLTDASNAAQATLLKAQETLSSTQETIGSQSQLKEQFSALLKELQGTARAVKNLADYLERHPEALIQGKGMERNSR